MTKKSNKYTYVKLTSAWIYDPRIARKSDKEWRELLTAFVNNPDNWHYDSGCHPVRLEYVRLRKTIADKIFKRDKHICVYCGSTDNLEIDHINRNPKDNRKSNLRIVESYKNSVNKKIREGSTSGIIGVNWDKNRSKWMVRISYKNKTTTLGRFDNKNEAIKTRLKAELEYFGRDFAPQRHLFEEYGVGVNE